MSRSRRLNPPPPGASSTATGLPAPGPAAGQTPGHLWVPKNMPCPFDLFMRTVDPNHEDMTPERMRGMFIGAGASDTVESLDEYKAHLDGLWTAAINKGIPQMGKKPARDDPDVGYVRIPDSDYAVRIWDGGMADFRQFCVDFFDTRRGIAVGPPAGYALYPYAPGNAPGAFAYGGALVSWEEAHRDADAETRRTAEGDASVRFSAPEGACLQLVRGGRPDIVFRMPVRQRAHPVQIVEPVYPLR